MVVNAIHCSHTCDPDHLLMHTLCKKLFVGVLATNFIGFFTLYLLVTWIIKKPTDVFTLQHCTWSMLCWNVVVWKGQSSLHEIDSCSINDGDCFISCSVKRPKYLDYTGVPEYHKPTKSRYKCHISCYMVLGGMSRLVVVTYLHKARLLRLGSIWCKFTHSLC